MKRISFPSRDTSPATGRPARRWPAVLGAALALQGCADQRPPLMDKPAAQRGQAPAVAARPHASPVATGTGAKASQVVVDLSSPRAAMTTYYRAMAAGDAAAAREAVSGDEMAMRYVDAAAALAAGVHELEAALAAKFGPGGVTWNAAFARAAAQLRGDAAARAIADGDVRLSGDIAIVTPRAPSPASGEAPADRASPVQPMPGVVRNLDGRWKLLIGAMRRHLYGRQAREADAAIEANAQTGLALHDLAAEVAAGRYQTVEEAWTAGPRPPQFAVDRGPNVTEPPAPPPRRAPPPKSARNPRRNRRWPSRPRRSSPSRPRSHVPRR